jgi:spore germination protein (amino acid permease)
VNKQRIGGYQLVMFVSILYIHGGTISLFKVLAEVSGQDAWFNFYFPMLYALFISFLLYRLSCRFPGKNMFQISEEVCGKTVGRLINGLVLVDIIHLLVRDLRLFGDFVGTSILTRTPLEYILLISILVLIYYGTGNLEELARAVNLLFPSFICSILLMPFLLLNEIHLSNIEPVLANGWQRVLNGGFLGTGWAGDVFVMGMFLPNVKTARQFYVSTRYGIVLSAAALTILMVLNTTVLGVTITSRAMYPNYTLMEQINITDFIDRLDLALIVFWMPMYLLKVILLYFAFMGGLSTFLKTEEMRGLNIMSGWFLLMLTLVSFNSVIEAYLFGNYAFTPLTLLVHACFFGAVFGFAAIRRLKGRRPGAFRGDGVSDAGREAMSGPERQNRPMAGRFRGGGRTYGIRVALAVCFVAILFGGYTGHLNQKYGMVGGAAYIVSFIVLLVLVAREARALRKL